jgi:hypothetical protein
VVGVLALYRVLRGGRIAGLVLLFGFLGAGGRLPKARRGGAGGFIVQFTIIISHRQLNALRASCPACLFV